MGFVHPAHEGMVENFGVELDPRGNVKADTSDYQTSVPGVFTAGDMRRGQSLVVWAIREGRQCARSVDEYLMGRSLFPIKRSSCWLALLLSLTPGPRMRSFALFRLHIR